MDPNRRLSEIGLGGLFVNDTTDGDNEKDDTENRDDNIRNDVNNSDDNDNDGLQQGKEGGAALKGQGSDTTNKRTSISLACLEALQQVSDSQLVN